MLMSCAVEEEARTVQGKKAIAAESFGRALRQIPTILADNAGYDSSDLVSKFERHIMMDSRMLALVCQIYSYICCFFLKRCLSDMNEGTIGSMRRLGVTESYKLKRQVVLSASEAAEMILRYVTPSSRISQLLIGCVVSTIYYGPRPGAERRTNLAT